MCEVRRYVGVMWCTILVHLYLHLCLQFKFRRIILVPQRQAALDSVLLVFFCRFTLKERAKHQPCAFLPFGYGWRNCIGMRFAVRRLKMVLIELLTHYKMGQSSITKVPLERVQGVTITSFSNYTAWKWQLEKKNRIYMAIWSQRIAATLVACVAETPR